MFKGISQQALAFDPRYAWGLLAVLMASFLALFLSLQAGIWVLLFVLLAWWVWEYPEEGFLFFLITAPILPELKITQTIGTVTLVKDVVILTLFLKLFFIPLLTKRLPYRRNILFAPIVALVLWSVFNTLRADSLILGVLRLRDIGLYILLYFAVLYLDHGKAILKRRLVWLTGSVAALLLLGVWQWYFSVDSAVLRFDPIRSIWIPRISSVMAHPSIFGEYMVMAAALFGSLFIYVRRTWYKILFGGLVIAVVPFIFLTYSRAVWIGLAVAGVAMALAYSVRLAKKKLNRRKLTGIVVGSLILFMVVLVAAMRLTPIGVYVRAAIDPTYGSNEERLEFFIRLVAPTTSTEAIVGRGLGDVLEQNFRVVDLEVIDIASGSSRSVQLTKNRTLVDNQYLKTFIEMGVVGIGIYLWLYWRLGAGAITQVLRNKDSIVALWVVGFLAAFTVQALFIDIWDIFPTNAAFWVVAGLLSQGVDK